MHLLLENPWPIVIVLIGVAAVLRVVGRRNDKRGLSLAALIALLAAVGVYVLATLVDTPREQVTAATHALLDATVAKDAAAIDRLLDPRVVLADERGNVRLTIGELRPGLDRTLERFDLASQRAKNLLVDTQTPDAATAHLDLRTGFTDNAFPPSHTRWQLDWRRDADGRWRLTEVRWLEWMGQTPPWHGLP